MVKAAFNVPLHRHNPPLGLGALLFVPLGIGERCVTGERLRVAQAAPSSLLDHLIARP
jgi:hypothetical protein